MQTALTGNKENTLTKLLQLIGTEATVENIKQAAGIRVIQTVQQQAPGLPIAVLQRIMKCVDKYCTQALQGYNATQTAQDTYNRHFNEAEMGVLIKFYSSPTGQKLLKLGQQINDEITGPVQQSMAAILPQLQEEVTQILQESGE